MQPKFAKRHYKAIAAIIADLPPDCYGVEQVARHFEKALLDTNPAFDGDRFYTAAIGQPSNGRDTYRPWKG